MKFPRIFSFASRRQTVVVHTFKAEKISDLKAKQEQTTAALARYVAAKKAQDANRQHDQFADAVRGALGNGL